MTEPIRCVCGATLLEAVSPQGVTPIGGEPIPFRRETDYVVCPDCHKVYKARDLLRGAPPAESFVGEGGDSPEDLIERLERMLESDRPEE